MKRRSLISLAISLAIPFALLTSAERLSAQTKYYFPPGSRQAVEVPNNSTPAYQQGASYSRSGGMSVRGGGAGTAGAGTAGFASAATSGGMHRRANTSSSAGALGTGVARYANGTPYGSRGKGNSQSAGSKDYEDFVDVAGLHRSFTVHLPPSYSRSRPIPAVLVFPGLKMHGAEMPAVTGMNGVANRNDFMVVYGESYGGEWNDGMKNTRVDDVAYVQAVLNRLQETAAIDRHRIYAVGLSNGGYFVQLLACSLPDKIAAIGVVSSTGMEGALTKSSGQKAIPVCFFLGTDDPLINWGDGKPKTVPKLGVQIDPDFLALARYGGWWTVPDLISWWTNHNGCPGSPSTSYEPDRDPNDGMRVKKESWGHRGNGVLLYTIEGGGHTWPGCIFLAKAYDKKCCQDIDTSEALWQFFRGESR